MSQRRWIEYMANYDFFCTTVADALSQKKHVVFASVFVKSGISIQINSEVIMHILGLCWLFSLVAQPTLVDRVREAQTDDKEANITLAKVAEG